MIVPVGEEASMQTSGGESDVEVTVTSVRTQDGVAVTANAVVRDGAAVKSTLPLRFTIG